MVQNIVVQPKAHKIKISNNRSVGHDECTRSMLMTTTIHGAHGPHTISIELSLDVSLLVIQYQNIRQYLRNYGALKLYK